MEEITIFQRKGKQFLLIKMKISNMEMHPLFKQIQANWFSQSGAISIKCNIDILKCDLRFLVILLCIIHLLVKRLDMVVYKNVDP